MTEYGHARAIAHCFQHQRKVLELRRGRRCYLAQLHRERRAQGADAHLDDAIETVNRLLGRMARAAARRRCVRIVARRPVTRAARPIGVRTRRRTRSTSDPDGDGDPEPRQRTSSSGGAL